MLVHCLNVFVRLIHCQLYLSFLIVLHLSEFSGIRCGHFSVSTCVVQAQCCSWSRSVTGGTSRILLLELTKISSFCLGAGHGLGTCIASCVFELY